MPCNLEKSLGKDCQTQLKASASANISERLSRADVIFSAFCGISVSTWPKQPPFYYRVYTRALLEAWKTGLFLWQKRRTTSVALGTKGCLSACESGSGKWFLRGDEKRTVLSSNRAALLVNQGCVFSPIRKPGV